MIIGDYYYEFPQTLPRLEMLSPYFVVFVLLCFFLSRAFQSRLRPFVLLVANLIFLYSFSLYHLCLLCELALVGYLFSLLLLYKKNRITLGVAVLACLAVLFFFKYQGYWKISLTIPLGLSYVTFKLISYYADIYTGKTKGTRNPVYFFDYVLFFSLITAGPINRFEPFYQTIANKQELEYRDAKNGGFQLMLGIFEKKVFCDYLSDVMSRALNSGLGGLNTLLAVILYSFVIYLDFDACSNIAIGTARLMGFSIPKNFNSPYLSATIKEFWNRWHISLSTWFRDYVYIPLGGNRKGKALQYAFIMIVFVLSGIWHGSTLNFVIWGLLHGLLRVIEDIVLLPFKNSNKTVKLIARPFGILINFALVTFFWLFFRYQTLDQVTAVLQDIAKLTPLSLTEIGLTFNEQVWLGVVLFCVLITDILRKHFDMLETYAKGIFPLRWIGYAVLIVVFLIFGVYGGSFAASDFIYKYF